MPICAFCIQNAAKVRKKIKNFDKYLHNLFVCLRFQLQHVD